MIDFANESHGKEVSLGFLRCGTFVDMLGRCKHVDVEVALGNIVMIRSHGQLALLNNATNTFVGIFSQHFLKVHRKGHSSTGVKFMIY